MLSKAEKGVIGGLLILFAWIAYEVIRNPCGY
jgi:hypothetical protein